MSTSALYRQHLDSLDRQLADALERAGRQGLPLDGVLFHAGFERTYHADDRVISYAQTPHFKRWVPPLGGPDHALLAMPGAKPKIFRFQPRDFWYDTSPAPPSYWEEHVELSSVGSFEELAAALQGALAGRGRIAYVGSGPELAAKLGIPAERVEPAALMKPLDWHRAVKTPYEVELLELACRKAADGHRAGRVAFEEGGSERDVFWAYYRASNQVEGENPFDSIVAFDEKAAILHYQHKRGGEAAPGRTLILDAGAAHAGYAADVTRTWTRPGTDATFRALVEGVDRYERDLVAMVSPGRSYVEIHLEAHRRCAALLVELGILRCSADEAVAKRVTRTFFPHGVGHHLGIQVHDVGGKQATPDGGELPPPDGHVLRNTRTLEPGHFVTVEPGIYFIPMLLEPLQDSPEGALVDWPLVRVLTQYGGVRIEDDVLCTTGSPRDLTRPLIEGPRGV